MPAPVMRRPALFVTPLLLPARHAAGPPLCAAAAPTSRRAWSGRAVLAARAGARFPGAPESARRGVRMFDDAGGDAPEGLPDDPDDAPEAVVLRDAETGRTLSCGVEHVVEHEGDTYLLCYPVHDVVMLAKTGPPEAEEELVSLDDREQIDELFPAAEKALLDDAMVLRNTGFFLTMDDMREVLDDDEGEEEEEEEDDEVEVITDFEYEGETFLVVRPVFPVFVIAKEVGDDLVVLAGEEMERISAIVDEKMILELAADAGGPN